MLLPKTLHIHLFDCDFVFDSHEWSCPIESHFGRSLSLTSVSCGDAGDQWPRRVSVSPRFHVAMQVTSGHDVRALQGTAESVRKQTSTSDET